MPAYAAVGWTGVFPVAPATKHPALKGMTGRDGAQTRPEQYNRPTVVEQYATYNVGLRLAPGLVGIDVDDYEGKTGGATLAALEARLGQLPPTYSSTARGDGPSRIRLYRVPEDCGELAGIAGPDIEVIQHHHRYTVVWPSVHPKTGTLYRWYAPDGTSLPDGEVPPRNAFPALPAAWLEHLSKAQRDHAPGAGLSVEEFTERCTDETDPDLVGRIRERFQARQGARHDTMLQALGWAARSAAQGKVNAGKIFDLLEEDWTEAMTGESRDTDREFAALLERAVADAPEPGSEAAVEAVDTHLPEGFWSSRKVLEHIRRAAHARAVPADAVLYGVLTRIASVLPGDLRVDTGMMNPVSLNLFTALVADSGVGKTASQGVADELVPVPDQLKDENAYQNAVPIGTGEGLVEVYMGKTPAVVGTNKDGSDKTQWRRQQVRHNASIYVDEGKTLTTLMTKREGSTLGQVIRTAWTGKPIGQMNGTDERTRLVRDYALGLVVGFQPCTALPLFEGVDEGTPQRFIWAVADDPSIPDEAPADPGPLWDGPGWLTAILKMVERDPFATGPNLIRQGADGAVTLADTIKRRLRAEHLDRQRKRAEVDLHDSHRPLMMIKLSVLLALLDGRTDATEDDWSTAAVMWGASRAVRQALLETARRDKVRVKAERREERVQDAVAVHQAKAEASDKVERVARRLWGVVVKKGPLARSALKRDHGGRDKTHVDAALSLALARGWLDEEESARGTKIVQGSSQPAP